MLRFLPPGVDCFPPQVNAIPVRRAIPMTLRDANLRGSRCVLAAVVAVKDRSAPKRLDDLETQLVAAGAVVVARVVQRRGVSRARSHASFKNFDTGMSGATFLGSGKTRELVATVDAERADLVVFLNPLRGSQATRLASLTGCRVLSSNTSTAS